VKAADNGKIFGAITAVQLVEVLRSQTGYIADRKDISFQYPIKVLGLHKAMVKLHKDVVATVQINVVAEADQ
jgi:large subunit ribosomal protein L9